MNRDLRAFVNGRGYARNLGVNRYVRYVRPFIVRELLVLPSLLWLPFVTVDVTVTVCVTVLVNACCGF